MGAARAGMEEWCGYGEQTYETNSENRGQDAGKASSVHRFLLWYTNSSHEGIV
jgi:hypothetical protein